MIRTLIVDDEPLARELLEAYLGQMQGFVLAGSCQHALEAFAILSKEPIDLLLLDINMPGISGMELLRSLKNPPKIIFTTAYTEYAIQSYELNAIDYLLKPITFDRFVQAMQKLQQEQETPIAQDRGSESRQTLLFVKSEGKMVRIDLEQLWHVEGYKNYIRLWVGDKKFLVHSTMQKIEEELRRFPQFIRISKSAIINLHHVVEIEANCIRIKGAALLIGSTYRQEVLQVFEQYKFL
jgi:DNA-binding LytR/AlgR family response regulator